MQAFRSALFNMVMIGSVLLFLALAGVMFATRNIDWSNVGRKSEETGA